MFSEQQSPLGKTTEYLEHYQPSLLFPICRKKQRQQIGIDKKLPFKGVDIWNAYELSWLNPGGKPFIAMGEIFIPADSPKLIESKSMKLYLNSFNQTVMGSIEEVQAAIQRDLSRATDSEVKIHLKPLEKADFATIKELPGEGLDDLDVTVERYEVSPTLLQADENSIVTESLHSHLLKSNCLVTGQPDWASLLIRYTGPKISRKDLLKYIISFRRHQGFHEQCVEQIFADISKHCKPEKLSVHARYTRRGGLDINPFRSNFETEIANMRLNRQ